MTLNETKYNGWTNWSTWMITHCFDNSEFLQELQERMRKAHSAEHPVEAADVRACVLVNWEYISTMASMSTDELQLVEWPELAESWSADWFDTGRPLYGPEDPEPGPESEVDDGTNDKLCPICKKGTYPPGRVVARCDDCIARWRRYQATL